MKSGRNSNPEVKPQASRSLCPLPQRSSLTGVPFLELQGVLELNPLEVVEVYQDEELVHMWLAVKIRPLLRSVSKHFLACLSTKNFSCTTYQAVYGCSSFSLA